MSDFSMVSCSHRLSLSSKTSERSSEECILSHDCHLTEKIEVDVKMGDDSVQARQIQRDLHHSSLADLKTRKLLHDYDRPRDEKGEEKGTSENNCKTQGVWKKSQTREVCKVVYKIAKSIALWTPIPPSKKELAAKRPKMIDVAEICGFNKL